MDRKKCCTIAVCACLLAAGLSGCSSARDGGNAPEESSAAETTAAVETTTAAPETTTTAAETTTTTSETTKPVTEAPDETREPIQTNAAKQDDDCKLLWSERGLEIVPIDSEDGYGEELRAGESYLDWTLESFDGFPNDDKTEVSELHADFTYHNGTLSTNGILTVLPSSHPDYPNGLYLRVDNQADFPYFPKDSRERGKFIIENAADVFKQLELDDPPVSEQYEIAVTVTVESLHVHYAANGYDTIRITTASKR